MQVLLLRLNFDFVIHSNACICGDEHRDLAYERYCVICSLEPRGSTFLGGWMLQLFKMVWYLSNGCLQRSGDCSQLGSAPSTAWSRSQLPLSSRAALTVAKASGCPLRVACMHSLHYDRYSARLCRVRRHVSSVTTRFVPAVTLYLSMRELFGPNVRRRAGMTRTSRRAY
jgi:hypothetical protein